MCIRDRRRDDARNDVEGNQPFLSGLFAIHREGDADAMEGQVGLGSLAGDTLGRCRLQPLVVSRVMSTDAVVGVHHFVIEVPALRVAVEARARISADSMPSPNVGMKEWNTFWRLATARQVSACHFKVVQ